jgi:hypothetical protein
MRWPGRCIHGREQRRAEQMLETMVDDAAPWPGTPSPLICRSPRPPFDRPMEAHMQTSTSIRIGRALSGLAVLFLLFDSIAKLVQVQPVIDGTLALGYPRTIVFTLGVILLACVIAYVIPRTSALGAILLTAYLGGAVATHVRVGNPLFSHILFPTYLAAFLWAGLILRDARLRVLLPVRSES